MPSKYVDFAAVFLPKLAVKLSKHIRINDYAIELGDDWKPLYGFTYSLELVELEILKTYIQNNLATGFMGPSKYPARVSIFFDKKPDGSLRLCINY